MHSMKSRFVGRVVDGTARAAHVSLVALSALASSACSSGVEGSNGTPAKPESTSEERSAIACGRTEFGTEAYQLSAMNEKLRHYPDFAAELGMDRVSDCEGARAFVLGYAQYMEGHPDFDRDQPISRTPLLKPALPADFETPLELPKILNGSASLREAVVQINFTTADGDIGRCSGTFIAKNWVLTAAHCILDSAVDNCVEQGIPLTSPDCLPEFNNWAKWKIKRVTGPDIDTWALASVHKNYLGQDLTKDPDIFPPPSDPPGQRAIMLRNLSRRDVALLYLLDDRMLPPVIEPPIEALNPGTLRINNEQPPINMNSWQLRFYGWGQPTSGVQMAALNQTTMSYERTDEIVLGTPQAGNMTQVPCVGDSGGPLVRVMSVPTRQGTMLQEVIVGVHSYGSTPCTNPTPSGRGEVWARTDMTFDDFIEPTMKDWNGSLFECTKLAPSTNPTGPKTIRECWTAPCSEDHECLPTEYCSGPGSDFKDCNSLCGAGSSDCGCIKGQCLLKPED